MDRLKRETSPTPGFKPAILPQHEKADGSSLTTGENNPLPVGNYVQNDSGIWVPVSKQNPMPTQLTGSTVELVLEQNEIAAGSWKSWSGINTKGYSRMIIGAYVVNDESHDFVFDKSGYLPNGEEIDRETNIFSVSGDFRGVSGWLPVTTNNLRLYIVNRDQTSAHSYIPMIRLSQ